MNHKKTGVLLINLGTPDSPTIPDIRRYLAEFLMDPYVVNLPFLVRYILVKGIILRTRPAYSAKAYQAIWTEKGSPLLVNSQALVHQLTTTLPHRAIALGMRYGRPSIADALDHLMKQPLEKLFVIPLFPQYSEAATQSAIDAFLKVWRRYSRLPKLNIIREFYNHPGFIAAYAKIIRNHLNQHPQDFLLMSYHGLPLKQLKPHCAYYKTCAASVGPCGPINNYNSSCYRAQCYDTSRRLAQQLNLNESDYAVSFQSRLGKTPWIKPYTDTHLTQLREQGIENLAVACPGFVADCLETLEEIALRAAAQWQQLGGKRFTLLPCLNAESEWIHSLLI